MDECKHNCPNHADCHSDNPDLSKGCAPEPEPIFVYTRQNAIDDGVFVDVTETAQEAGIKFPVAVTSNLYHTHICPDPMPANQDERGRLWDLLMVFLFTAKQTKDSFMEFNVKFGQKVVKVWAVCEAQSPTDPSPAINIMLPEDY